MEEGALLIACGALAKELVGLQRSNDWSFLKIQCLPAELHNTPEEIPRAVEEAIQINKSNFQHIFIAYADCGTGGILDKVIQKHGVQRIPGAHCYEFFSGKPVFDKLSNEEIGTFYLTDFLVRHFDRLVVQSLGLDRHPELRDMYFGNYRRLVYLAQKKSDELSRMAQAHAELLGLEYVEHYTSLKPFEQTLKEQVVQWQS